LNIKSYTFTLPVPVDYFNLPIESHSNSFTYKLGKTSAKFTNFFKKKETQVRTLITYWAIETVLFALVLVGLTTFSSIFAALFLYAYGTYAIFCAVAALIK